MCRRADSTIASGVAVPYFFSKSFSSEPPLTPMRIGMPRVLNMYSMTPIFTGYFASLGLKPENLAKIVTIRGEPHSVPLALERSLGHTCYHIGQIVQVARIHAGDKWNTLTIPRGASEQFNKTHWGQTGKSHS